MPDEENDDIISRIDDCMTHMVFKSGLGYLVGQLLVRYYLKGQRWPPIVGIAVGASHAWIHCRILDIYRPRAAAAEAKAEIFGQLLIIQMDANDKKFSKDESFFQRFDLCMTDIVFKSGFGLIVGNLLEKCYFIGHRWPPIVGVAVGMSHAWALCRVTTLYKPNAPCAIDEPIYTDEVQEAMPEGL